MNGLTSHNLESKGLFTLGRASNFFNIQNVAKILDLNLKVYHGNSYKVNLTSEGMNLVINPKCRIIREKSALEEYLNCPREMKAKFFYKKEAFCVYNKKIIVIDGIDDEISLQTKFPSLQYKNYQEYYE